MNAWTDSKSGRNETACKDVQKNDDIGASSETKQHRKRAVLPPYELHLVSNEPTKDKTVEGQNRRQTPCHLRKSDGCRLPLFRCPTSSAGMFLLFALRGRQGARRGNR